MSNPNIFIGSLFEKNRLPQSIIQNAIFFLYFPIGLILAIIRTFITIQVYLAAFILPPMTYIRCICFRILFSVLGIVTTKDKKSEERDDSAPVMVANHVSKLDCIPLHILTGCVSPSMWELPSSLSFVLGLSGSEEKPGSTSDMVAFFRTHLTKSIMPILLFPEEETTNGFVGLLKFSEWTVTVSSRIQPVAIRVWRPWFMHTNVSVLGASWYSDLFWYLVSPCTFFNIRYLPTIERNEDESDEAFAKRLQKTIADCLNISVTQFSAQDKRDYEKRYLIELNMPTVVKSRPNVSAEVLQKANQVVQVLPHVPLEVAIRQLLKNQKNIDITISNILEDPSIAPVSVPSASSASSQNTANRTKEPVNQNAGIFSSSPQVRMSSFNERKALLIAEARKKYIEKHGLNIE